MNVNSFQDHEYEIPCKAYSKHIPSIGQSKYWRSNGQAHQDKPPTYFHSAISRISSLNDQIFGQKCLKTKFKRTKPIEIKQFSLSLAQCTNIEPSIFYFPKNFLA